MFDLAKEVETRLMQRGHRGEALASLIVLSAILNGALLRSEGWVALWSALARGRVEVKRSPVLGDAVWVDLPIGEKEEFRFYPDVVTLSLLARWRLCSLPPCRTVSLHRDLFGRTSLIREWGRIGQMLIETHEEEGAAKEALSALEHAKEKRGYRAS